VNPEDGGSVFLQVHKVSNPEGHHEKLEKDGINDCEIQILEKTGPRNREGKKKKTVTNEEIR
jgi:hypothetical protein